MSNGIQGVIQRIRGQLPKIDAELDRLDQRIGELEGDARFAVENEVLRLRAEYVNFKNHSLRPMKETVQEQMEDAGDALVQGWEDIESSLEAAKEELDRRSRSKDEG